MRVGELGWFRWMLLSMVLMTAVGSIAPLLASAAPAPERAVRVDQDPTATPTATEPAQPTPVEPTATPTDGGQNLLLRGSIYVVTSGPDTPVAGAKIRVPPCQTPHQAFEATSGSDGRYELVLPSPYFLPGCTIRIRVSAECFLDVSQELRWEQVRDQPVRDYGLVPIVDCGPGGHVYLPYADAGER